MPGIFDIPTNLGNWWQDVSDGWHNFWIDLDDRIDALSQTYFAGDMATVAANTPGAAEDFYDIVAGNGLGIDMPGQNPTHGTEIGQDGSTYHIDSDIESALSGSTPSIAQYVSQHPNLSGEDYLRYMAQHSDEWAEKYIDYIMEKQSIDEQNAYLANREDTAYQRLTQDLKNAGLNPAMMYGGSASVQGGSTVGPVKLSEGSNSRNISNYEKLKKLLIAYMALQLQSARTATGSISSGLQLILSMLG